MNPDHSCYWTRHHRTLLTRRGRSLSGAGVPVAVLRYAASLLNVPMVLRSLSERDCDDDVRIGEQAGRVHDGCFVGFDDPTAQFEDALLEGIATLHAKRRR